MEIFYIISNSFIFSQTNNDTDISMSLKFKYKLGFYMFSCLLNYGIHDYSNIALSRITEWFETKCNFFRVFRNNKVIWKCLFRGLKQNYEIENICIIENSFINSRMNIKSLICKLKMPLCGYIELLFA